MAVTEAESETLNRRLSNEFWAIVSVGLVVLGQAAWLDAKIERGDTRLEHKLSIQIQSLQMGQTAIRERLAALEALSGKTGQRAPVMESESNAETTP